MSAGTQDRIATGRLLRLSGISPSDLHNWVRRGLLPRPCARYVMRGRGSRVYYPAWALDRAWNIKRLRSHGVPMQYVRAILGGEKVDL
jgi:DNA-binding transcriptional MerR regulator